MGKILKYFLTINLMGILAISTVNAECSYTDKATLNKIAANVKINYEILTEEKDVSQDPDYTVGEGNGKVAIDYISLSVFNVAKEITVEQIDNLTGEIKVISLMDTKDGLATQRLDDLSFIRKYTYKIYGSGESVCPSEPLKTINLTLPKYNVYSESGMCESDPDFYLCNRYVTTDNITEDTFNKKMENYVAGKVDINGEKVDKKESILTKSLNFISDNKYYVAGGVLIIIAGAVVLRRMKTKKQRELGL